MYTFKDFNVNAEKSTLTNGVPVLLLQRKGMPIHIEIRFASGARFDPKGKEGLSHFVEHMIVSGSKRFPSKDRLAVHIEQLGGIFGAWTSTDDMFIRVEVVGKDDFKEGVSILREMLTESLFDDKTIETERGSILKEIGDSLSNPSRHVWRLYYKLSFQGTPLGRTVLGSVKTVESITNKDLINFYKDMLVSGRAAIIISGDIEMQDVVRELERGLPLRSSEKFNCNETLPLIRNENVLVHKYPNQNQVHLVLGFRTAGIKDKDVAPLSVLSYIIGGGRASSLQKKLRYEKGLVYNAFTSSLYLADGGTWAVKTSTSKDKLQEVVDIIIKEFKKIEAGGITDEELMFGKTSISKSSRRRMQTSGAWVGKHAKNVLVKYPDYFPDYLNAVQAVKMSDLSRVGKKYFLPNSWYLAMCGDIDEKSVVVNY